MADAKQLPVLQGHWRLLEPTEVVQINDEQLDLSDNELDWLTTTKLTGLFVEHRVIRRRVAPPPTCGTCYTCEHHDVDGEYIDGVCHATACCALGVDISATDVSWDKFSCCLYKALNQQVTP